MYFFFVNSFYIILFFKKYSLRPIPAAAGTRVGTRIPHLIEPVSLSLWLLMTHAHHTLPCHTSNHIVHTYIHTLIHRHICISLSPWMGRASCELEEVIGSPSFCECKCATPPSGFLVISSSSVPELITLVIWNLTVMTSSSMPHFIKQVEKEAWLGLVWLVYEHSQDCSELYTPQTSTLRSQKCDALKYV